MRAAAALRARGIDFVIQVAGDGWLREHLKQETRERSLTEHIEFIGYTDDIPLLLNNATFLVHTSDSEGYPNAVLEAMASGRAVVATGAGDIPYIVEHGTTGFVIPRDDEASLVSRMVTLIRNPDLCRRMGAAGRARVEEQFGLEHFVSGTLTAYQSLGGRPLDDPTSPSLASGTVS